MLIAESECNETLYSAKHVDYKNRNKIQHLYKTIADAINNVKPGCSIEDVKKKINGLRNQYLMEKMKVLNSIKSGADGDDVYKPTVYWYPMLHFLEMSTDADSSESNLDNENELSTNVQPVSNNGNHSQCRATSASQSNSTTGQSNKRQMVLNTDSLLLQASTTMAEMSQLAKERRSQKLFGIEDSFDTFGKFVATELRAIDNECHNALLVRQAKRKIQQILMDTWDTVDSETLLSSTPSSLDSFSNNQTIFVHTLPTYATDVSTYLIAKAIHSSNLSDTVGSEIQEHL